MRLHSLAGMAMLVFSAAVATAPAAPTTFAFTGGFQAFVAPTMGTYYIVAFGA